MSKSVCMHESERNLRTKEIRRLVFAQSDMAQAAVAAEYLLQEHVNGDLCRALETAIVVCYARPFAGGNNAGILGEDWYPIDPAHRAMHDKLRDLRDQVFAHNDITDKRGIVDAGAMLGLPGSFAEEWMPLNREALPTLIQMCAAQRAQFSERVDELQAELNQG